MKNANPSSAMQGKYGEKLALDYLLSKGWKFITKNYRFKRSEIDLIMYDGSILVFIEVKFRTSQSFGHPEEFVSSNQQNKIHEAALRYLEEYKLDLPAIRFDIISILMTGDQAEIKLFKDAF